MEVRRDLARFPTSRRDSDSHRSGRRRFYGCPKLVEEEHLAEAREGDVALVSDPGASGVSLACARMRGPTASGWHSGAELALCLGGHPLFLGSPPPIADEFFSPPLSALLPVLRKFAQIHVHCCCISFTCCSQV